ncbi:DUF5117 domain-containing protein [Phragmitibacter flavus]|uniref:DUF5117 domain-containing protein n=1 Tax=Phragmitibacter flavus TaxID=2576071 RepID=A0A5R8KJS8_9BACT|nr:zinc-dependent metalloprotease [Phragmitibacter flavus]TLD71869.1 DUF5117 domain-containing protein [Phragmitibacter flavus]
MIRAALFLPVFVLMSVSGLVLGEDDKAPVADESAGQKKVEEKKVEDEEKDDKKKKKTVAEVIKDCEEFPGLMRVWRDREKGTVYLYVTKEQLGREFIYFSHEEDGVVAAGSFRGRFGDQSIIKISRHFGKVEFTRQNTAFYFDPSHPLARAAEANTSHALLAVEPIVAEDDKGVLIEGGNLFLKETLLQVKPSVKEGKDSLLGKLSDSKTKITSIKNYPQNTAIKVEYVYDTPLPPASKDGDDERVDGEFADRRAISVTVQHSLIEMPKNDYEPRFDDARIGYFATKITDQTSTEATPWRDVIHRWDLRKKDPAAALSEPREPIVWWMENTTPMEFRDTIRSAALQWNKSFEKIGLKDVIVIKQQPDDADWDAGDIRYNVLRWTSSPNPPFGGYGPSFVNPRTGQILGADIMLEFVFVKNRLFARKLWSEAGLPKSSGDHGHDASGVCCEAGLHVHQGVMFGQQMLRLRAADEVEMDKMMKEALTMLVLHEIGHTLGLNHNFKASHLHGLKEVNDRALTERTGLTGSVMDYMPMNLGPDKERQGQYYITNPGPYDDWAIDFGYSQALPNREDEVKRLAALAGRSHEPQLMFGNDADDMRDPGKAIDPRAMIGDMSSDPIGYAVQRIGLVREANGKLMERFSSDEPSWQELTNAYLSLTTDQGYALTTISRYVGGMYVERAIPGQVKEKGSLPLRPVEGKTQVAAMQALAKFAFAPDAWPMSGELLSHLQQQRRGFEFFKESENPKPHERVLKIQQRLLEHLMHSNTQNRMVESGLLGNEYPVELMMADLTKAVMSGEAEGAAISTIRQNLQLDYVDRLIGILKGTKHMQAVRSVALAQLRGIREQAGKVAGPNEAHFAHVLFKIDQALEVKR